MPQTHEAAPLSQALGRITVETRGRGFTDVTGAVRRWLAERQAGDGLLTLFLRHTSASLTVQENADPDVRADLLDALDAVAPENRGYRHSVEGPDDMPAHIKAALTDVSLSVPVTGGAPALGTWQAIYVIEHRAAPHRRELALHFLGRFADGASDRSPGD